MKNINCIIVDDEPLAIEGLKMYVEDYSKLNLIATFNKSIDAREFLKTNKNVDLLFLDIEMPNLSGFEIMDGVKNKPLIIFTTAYPEYALDAFDLNVIDYLLKPISPKRFKKAIDKTFYLFSNKSSQFEKMDDNYIFIKADRKLNKLLFNEILYIKGLKDYVIVYTKTSKLITAINIKNILLKLPKATFIRISKSYIININYVKIINNNSLIINNEELPIGKVYKTEFLKKIK